MQFKFEITKFKGEKSMKNLNRRISLTIALFLLASVILAGCANIQPEKQLVTATVTDKEYVESHTDYGYYYDSWKGKFRWKFKTFPAEYNITIEYEGISKTYDRRSLFDEYEIGDEIEMELTSYYDENNELITEGLHAPSISLP